MRAKHDGESEGFEKVQQADVLVGKPGEW